jgi:hypothetical protein
MSKPELIYECSYSARLKQPVDFGHGPTGHRMYFECVEGVVEGPRIRGLVGSGGGDWLFACTDGFGRLDVRASMTTDDGACILAQYHGLLSLNEAVMTALSTGSGTDYADQYFRVTPRFETGDERYQWLTQSVFVASGHVIPGPGVEYELYRVS